MDGMFSYMHQGPVSVWFTLKFRDTEEQDTGKQGMEEQDTGGQDTGEQGTEEQGTEERNVEEQSTEWFAWKISFTVLLRRLTPWSPLEACRYRDPSHVFIPEACPTSTVQAQSRSRHLRESFCPPVGERFTITV